MKPLFSWLTLTLALLWVGALVHAQDDTATPAASGIVFLRVRFNDAGNLELLEAQVRPGTLKAKAAAVHGATLRARVMSPAGTAQWSGEVEDPSTQRVEWEDPAQPGRLLSKAVERPRTEFMVRVPLYQKTQRVEFRREKAASSPTATTHAITAAAAKATDQEAGSNIVGSFDLRLP